MGMHVLLLCMNYKGCCDGSAAGSIVTAFIGMGCVLSCAVKTLKFFFAELGAGAVSALGDGVAICDERAVLNLLV